MCAGGCQCGPPPLDDGGTGSGVVLVNEVLAKNESVNVDEAGEHDDWVELYNPGAAEISLAGFALSDNSAAPRKLVFPDDVSLPAGGFLLVWADGDPSQGPLHADFRLAAEGEEVVLTDAEGQLVDHVTFGLQQADVSFGRFPDGEDALDLLTAPTPGAANAPLHDGGEPSLDAGPPPLAPVFNEVGQAGTEGLHDLAGEPSTAAWVELYNPHATAVPLEGLWLSPNPVAPRRFALEAPLVDLAPGAYAVVLLDDSPAGPGDHASFAFAAPGTLALADADGRLLERLDVPALPEGASFSRLPDGEGELGLGEPTPRAENAALAEEPSDGGEQG